MPWHGAACASACTRPAAPRGCISNQTPPRHASARHGVRRQPAEFRWLTATSLRLRQRPAHAEDALVCYAARKLGRPVKWRAERSEEFVAAHMARDQHYTAALALDREGRILALRMEMLANIGAVPVGSSAMIPLAMVAKVATSAYRVPAVDYRVKGVLTNTMATARTAAPDARRQLPIERLIEEGAREMGIDRSAAPAQPAHTRRVPTRRTSARDVRRGDFPRICSGACVQRIGPALH